MGLRLLPKSILRRRIILAFFVMVVLVLVALVGINLWIYHRGNQLIVDVESARPAQAALVLGAYVFPDGGVSGILRDRLETALELYRSKKVQKILVSGDHGAEDYDEVNAMRRFLERRGVPPGDIFMDHAGFDTYDSLFRARDVFQAHSVVVVTQDFHLPRAMYIASCLKLQAEGVRSDLSRYPSENYLRFRETGARIKAFADLLLARKPVFLGPLIPITGDGRRTHDLTEERHP